MPFEPTNADRANHARAALLAFAASHGQRFEDEPTEEWIADLVADLAHLARQLDHDARDLISRGLDHYDHETEESADRSSLEMPARTMTVAVYGPNLPNRFAEKGTLHVHRVGCTDTKQLDKVRALPEPWTIEVSTVSEIVFDIYPPDQFGYDPETEYEGYRSDVFVAPCVNLPERVADLIGCRDCGESVAALTVGLCENCQPQESAATYEHGPGCEGPLNCTCPNLWGVLIAALEGEGINGGIYCGEASDVLELFTWPEVRAAMRSWLDDRCPDGDSYATTERAS